MVEMPYSQRFFRLFSACDERAEKNQEKPLGPEYCGECFGQNI